MNKAVFLDRDGVINREIGDYIKCVEDFHVLEHAIKYIALLHQKGYKIIAITNQGGIAKGLYTHDELHTMHKKMLSEITLAGGVIDEVYYCPHHPDFGLCLCRKPGSLLVEKAIAKYHIDPLQSVFIGDKQRDIEAANKAGVRGVLICENQDWGFVVEEMG